MKNKKPRIGDDPLNETKTPMHFVDALVKENKQPQKIKVVNKKSVVLKNKNTTRLGLKENHKRFTITINESLLKKIKEHTNKRGQNTRYFFETAINKFFESEENK